MKKPKKPGENISLKTKKNESPEIIEWINSQTNLMDSIRYLIENEVMANGIRNLQNHIPAERVLVSKAAAAAREVEELKTLVSQRQAEAAAAQEPAGEAYDSSDEEAARLSEEFAYAQGAGESVREEEIDDEDIDSWL